MIQVKIDKVDKVKIDSSITSGRVLLCLDKVTKDYVIKITGNNEVINLYTKRMFNTYFGWNPKESLDSNPHFTIIRDITDEVDITFTVKSKEI